MKIDSNYSITRLFITKDIDIIIDNIKQFTIHLRPIKDIYTDDHWNIIYHLWTQPSQKLHLLLLSPTKLTSLEAINRVLFNLGQYDKFKELYTMFLEQLNILFTNFKLDTTNKCFTSNGVIITEEIWEYILYLLKLSYGEKVEKPLTFDSEEAKQFYLAQKAAEEKINAARSKKGDADGLSKMMLSITYAFPSFTFDYLLNQTMAQIQWLQQYAAGSVSYEVNAKAFAAGNVKKGKKLDFFIK